MCAGHRVFYRAPWVCLCLTYRRRAACQGRVESSNGERVQRGRLNACLIDSVCMGSMYPHGHACEVSGSRGVCSHAILTIVRCCVWRLGRWPGLGVA